jgi:cytoskeletal protein CcmA (bactofilin family)
VSDPSAQTERGVMPVVVEAGCRFDGLVSFRGTVRVDGLVVGQVVARGTVVLGGQGEVRGRIEADQVTVEGQLEGEIEAGHRIELRPTARVRGRMTAPRVVVADGATFDGQCEIGPARPEERAEPSLSMPERDPMPLVQTASISA